MGIGLALSVTHSRCDDRLTVTLSAARYQSCLAVTKLYRISRAIGYVHEKVGQSLYKSGMELLRVECKSIVLATTPPRWHGSVSYGTNIIRLSFSLDGS